MVLESGCDADASEVKGLFLTNARGLIDSQVNQLSQGNTIDGLWSQNSLFDFAGDANGTCDTISCLCNVCYTDMGTCSCKGWRVKVTDYDDFDAVNLTNWGCTVTACCSGAGTVGFGSSLVNLNVTNTNNAADCGSALYNSTACLTYGAYHSVYIKTAYICHNCNAGCSVIKFVFGSVNIIDINRGGSQGCTGGETGLYEFCQASGCCYDVYIDGTCCCQITKTGANLCFYSCAKNNLACARLSVDFVFNGTNASGCIITNNYAPTSNCTFAGISKNNNLTLQCNELFYCDNTCLCGSTNQTDNYNTACDCLYNTFTVCGRPNYFAYGWGALW